MADRKILLGNVRGEQGPAGPNTVSSSTTTSGFENGHLLYNNNGHVGAKSFLDLVYPVGSIFEWENSGTSGGPDLSTVAKVQSHFGGTWERYGDGRVLVAQKVNDPNFASAGTTGGEITHKLTEAELPHITGRVSDLTIQDKNQMDAGGIDASGAFSAYRVGGWQGYGTSISGTANDSFRLDFGSDQPHNNLQPYITVFRYRRIA